MRYELNFDEDKIIDIEAIGDNGVLGLKDCCKIMNEQQAIIQKEKGEKINAEEKLSYMVWKYNKLKQKNFNLQVKLSEVMENEH